MQLRFSQEDEAFRDRARTWLSEALGGEYALLKGRGGPGDEHALFEERLAWERHLGANGWIGLGWPKEYGGQELTLAQQVIFNEEYVRAHGPGRLGHIGEQLVGPTIMTFGTPEQKQRFLPKILRGEELWCQGYSEPDAGSDLANLSTRAALVEGSWVINGQKVWTSLAHWSDWCFVLARTDREAPRHRGISYLLVPMRQAGIEVRPIEQITGGSEFNEVFFNGARTDAENVVGEVNDGWRVAMGTLAFERGTSTLGQQLNFSNELDEIQASAAASGRLADPVIRQRIVAIWSRLQIMRFNTLRMLSAAADGRSAGGVEMILKLYWATLHRDMGELAVDVLGAAATVTPAPGELNAAQRLFLFSRSDTIYAGTNQIQRNIIGERALGLPR